MSSSQQDRVHPHEAACSTLTCARARVHKEGWVLLASLEASHTSSLPLSSLTAVGFTELPCI